MSDIQYPENGKKNVNLKSTDLCGNTRNGVREVNIIQRLLEGQYISILEDGDKATISADVSADYYNKAQINELLGDLDTVKFKVVSALPAVGAENVIYLVPKAAPEVGYEQYIWDSNDTVFYPIGDTDIDLSEYYTKTQSDTKFQPKLSLGNMIETVTDTTLFSYINLGSKAIREIYGLSIWNYIKSKFTGTAITPVTDSTRISGVDFTKAYPNQHFTAADLFGYVMNKLVISTEYTMDDNSELANVVPGSSPQIRRVTGSAIWNYIKSKLNADTLTSVTDSTKIGSVDKSKTNPVQEFTASTLFTYIWNKIKTDKWTNTVDANNQSTDVIPSASAVYNSIGKRILVNQYSVPDSGQTVAQVLTSAGLNISGGYACAYIRNTAKITDRPFADGGAVYVEVISRDATTRIVRWTDWSSWRCVTRSQQNGSWTSWYEYGITRDVTLTPNTDIVNLGSPVTTRAWRVGKLVYINFNGNFLTTTQGNIFTGLPKSKYETWGVVLNGGGVINVCMSAGGTALVKRTNGTAGWYKGTIIYECE